MSLCACIRTCIRLSYLPCTAASTSRLGSSIETVASSMHNVAESSVCNTEFTSYSNGLNHTEHNKENDIILHYSHESINIYITNNTVYNKHFTSQRYHSCMQVPPFATTFNMSACNRINSVNRSAVIVTRGRRGHRTDMKTTYSNEQDLSCF
jgi:hypothetical protein